MERKYYNTVFFNSRNNRKRSIFITVSIIFFAIYLFNVIGIGNSQILWTSIGLFIPLYFLSIISAILCMKLNTVDEGVKNSIIDNENCSDLYPKFCKICKVFVTLNSKHCSQCKICIQRFDHHCIWLNVCIGLKNYRFFICFLFFSLASNMISSIILVVLLSNHTNEHDKGLNDYFMNLLLILIGFGISIILCCIFLYLFVFHLVMIFKGITSYEYQRNKRKQRSRIYAIQPIINDNNICKETIILNKQIKEEDKDIMVDKDNDKDLTIDYFRCSSEQTYNKTHLNRSNSF